MHTDLFGHAENSAAVYAALQKDAKRDASKLRWANLIAAGLFGAALFRGAHDGWMFLVGGLVVALYTLNVFIDSSNRNFAMHVIDWMEGRERERKADAEQSVMDRYLGDRP
ncbi:hypothetical protein [Azospirillum picis]|uniref:Uncharacterized protein n=1 Tax=Azospirillum picis TaxID=488438 RepID=A0ABU0MVT6_9PROT|nr:hypothetical protein [Azospirillum picis]MBP2303438.1 hypothetical protein [Azospirillum picis]MDQ0537303.1 hypothetical protein [Azospirillum picis]